MKIRLLTLFKYFFFFALGIFFVWLSVRNINYDNWLQIKAAIARGRKWVILPVVFVLLIAHYSRAMRWKLLMEPLGYKPSDFNVFAAVMIGYMVNAAVPRLGEVFKCTILARYEKVKVDKLIGTILVERAVDMICLLIVFFLAIISQGAIFRQYMQKMLVAFFHDKTGNLSILKLSIALGAFLFFILLIYFILKKLGHIDLVSRIKTVIKNILQGLSSIKNLKTKRWFIFHSILIWSMYYLASYLGLFALRETQVLGLGGGLTTLAVGTIGMILTPNGIGAYPLLIAQLLGLYGLNPDTTGNASGWLMWCAQTFIILIGGLICFILISQTNKKDIQTESQENT
ncbi:MAG TPA: lysylphosphatidylglycerol synthase transmembrane domain-containing protein [Chitinophagaceae bacterium]|nr:lysylphosphatidylglycerol synthase transmembrane domain-containing protein [Chitinophagaceae bacterium]